MTKHVTVSRKTAFTKPGVMPGRLSADVAAALLAAVGDIALVLSRDGTVLDVAVSGPELAAHGFADWVGGDWLATVTVESRPKILEMIDGAGRADPEPRWRQVNHPTAGGDVPVRYLVMTLDEGDRLIAIGRDMRGAAAMQQRLLQTQQSLERDYIILRQAETRYRLLFDMTNEPVLVVDAGTRRIREANPAAHRLLDVAGRALVGSSIHAIVDAASRDDFIAYIGAAETADDVQPVTLLLADGRGEASLTARLFRQARQAMLLLRITASADAVATRQQHDTTLSDVVERMPDAFVLVDRELRVMTANTAFVEMTEMPSIERVTGARVATWLGRPGIDLEIIMAQLRDHGTVRNIATVLRGSAGAEEQIEVSGVVAPTVNGACYGFTIRSVGRRLRDAPAIARDVPRSVEQLTELVGRMSLKEIVRESTDLIERLCIEAALAYTSDNRASAAEILGVSRQSLYSKLHRHGLGNLTSSAE